MTRDRQQAVITALAAGGTGSFISATEREKIAQLAVDALDSFEGTLRVVPGAKYRVIPPNGPSQLTKALGLPDRVLDWPELHSVLDLIDTWTQVKPVEQDAEAFESTMELSTVREILELSGIPEPDDSDDPDYPDPEGPLSEHAHVVSWLYDMLATLRGYRRTYEDTLRAKGIWP